MKTEIFTMTEDVTYFRRGNFEAEICTAYKYDLLDNGIAGYRIQTTSGKTLHFCRYKADAIQWVKKYLRGRTK